MVYGVKEIYKVGGAQAILAMAYGTTIIPKVNKIFVLEMYMSMQQKNFAQVMSLLTSLLAQVKS